MSFAAALTSFSLGLLATASPCVLPLYPGFLAYLGGVGEGRLSSRGRYLLGFLVFAGVLTAMVLLGLVISLAAVSVGRALSAIIPLADTVLIVLGVLLLVGLNPFKALPQAPVPVLSNPYLNAFVYGTLYGPLALPCSGPLVVSIFAFSLTAGEALGRLATFAWFGLGFGVPLLALSLLSGAAQRGITRLFARHTRAVNLASGVLLVAIGLYDLAQNWELLRAFWG